MNRSIDAHRGVRGGGIKVYPPYKIFSNLINKNAIKHQKGTPSPQNFYNPYVPSLPKFDAATCVPPTYMPPMFVPPTLVPPSITSTIVPPIIKNATFVPPIVPLLERKKNYSSQYCLFDLTNLNMMDLIP